METFTTHPSGLFTDSKDALIVDKDGDAPSVEANRETTSGPLETSNPSQAGVELKSHLLINEMRVRQNGVFPMDEAIADALPDGFTFVSVVYFGYSAWTITGKLLARSSSAEKVFFVKIAYGETGRVMLLGEFESSKIIFNLMPDFIPEPFGYGKYRKADTPTYFYMSQFVDLDVTTAQDPSRFCQRLAELHRRSQALTTEFGFHVTTCDGDRAHVVEREPSWAVFYRKMLLHTLDLDVGRNGPWPEYERAGHQVAWNVIPRLLEGLTWNGEPVRPSLIHGDLWEGNTGISNHTNLPMLFDAGSYFAHNEMELGHWVCEFSATFGAQAYMDRYVEFFEMAEPADEFDDRVRLYSLKGGINYSAGHPGSRLRKSAYNSMCYLCQKYAPIDGIDAYDESVDPIKTGAKIVSHEEIN
ncbi:Protein-ribulosamine 3-kinase [Colletotrichum orbiculare MAFF 240422]|uniref:protein-ribulosamine 3-kinase n=1 Tax=Colletotrichum orbiculare (strain 104-T / ATCC 96160 / CBS 514.97 / LARS 414 / MAFF 240422) TaxID=1213857 RepID=N4VJD4_COLOR|nr:Protein-ribulosamine 3-kinase [Colletotrichum orbiculare MAFF 240422]